MEGTAIPELCRTAVLHQLAQLRRCKDVVSKSYAAQSNVWCNLCSAPWPCLTVGFDNFMDLRIAILALPNFTATEMLLSL